MKLNTLLSARRAQWKGSNEPNEGHAVELTAIRPTVTSTATLTHAQSDFYDPTASLPGFLRLPPELRNVIYDLVLPNHEYLSPLQPEFRRKTQHSLSTAYGHDDAYNSLAPTCNTATSPPLLHTCQMIRNESSPMYFARNIFVLDINESDDISFRTFGDVFGTTMAWLRPTRYSKTMDWLQSVDGHGVFFMRHILIVGREACSVKKCQSPISLFGQSGFAATVDFQPLEEAVQVQRQSHNWCDPNGILQVSEIMEDFVQLKATMKMPEALYKMELIDTIRKLHYKSFRSELLHWLVLGWAFHFLTLVVVGGFVGGVAYAAIQSDRHRAAHSMATVLAALNSTSEALDGVAVLGTSAMQSQLGSALAKQS
ncbi:hypothetical protein LTR10_002728 [Elasticomyces elasticus]|nr:hypothetical protein LTR10_002728 [Elasticomyces elasticus]KAK4967932.1 hypothetical protein LTR42_010260 [Elasticomyces elasticus]